MRFSQHHARPSARPIQIASEARLSAKSNRATITARRWRLTCPNLASGLPGLGWGQEKTTASGQNGISKGTSEERDGMSKTGFQCPGLGFGPALRESGAERRRPSRRSSVACGTRRRAVARSGPGHWERVETSPPPPPHLTGFPMMSTAPESRIGSGRSSGRDQFEQR